MVAFDDEMSDYPKEWDKMPRKIKVWDAHMKRHRSVYESEAKRILEQNNRIIKAQNEAIGEHMDD